MSTTSVKPFGRPTGYQPRFVGLVDKYIQTTGREQTKLPTRSGLALYIGVNDETLVEWEKRYPDFSAALKRLMATQRSQLIDDGLYGGKEVNPGMAIFLLKANHGMIETSRQEFTGPGGDALKFNFLIYGNNDPIQLRPEELERAGIKRLGPPGTVQGTELAPQGQEDNSGSQSAD